MYKRNGTLLQKEVQGETTILLEIKKMKVQVETKLELEIEIRFRICTSDVN
jgi:hypothetical protein